MWAIGGSFPHDPKTVGDRAPTVLLLVSACIAIAVGILSCYVYDAQPITNGSLLYNVYDARPITNGSPLRRLANRRTSVGQDYETSDHRNIVVHDNYRTRYSVVQRLGCILHHKQFMVANRVR